MAPPAGYAAFLFACTLVTLSLAYPFPSDDTPSGDGAIKSVMFRSPAFNLAPGEVHNTFYYDSSFVTGHIGIKGFDAEVVDEDGSSVPLNEVYLHHWIVLNYLPNTSSILDETGSSSTVLGNAGVCPHHTLSQLFGLGSETRATNTRLPGPYAIEAGLYSNEAWLINVHAIDTRGTVDPFGCLECRCSLYNVTVTESGQSLPDDYEGGLRCCYDGTRCQQTDGYVGENRTYYLQYTVHYLDWDDAILPVNVYIFDVTYDGSRCKVEYDIPECSSQNGDTSECTQIAQSEMEIPVGGDVVYGVAHQHAGGIGSAIYGQDGREICTSLPLYGNGTEAGNEAGYIVGMTTCYPEAGTIQVSSGETIRMVSNYSKSTHHTGVMGLGYIVVYPSSSALPM